MRRVLHRLFFTQNDELDLGWLLLLIGFVNGLTIFDLAALGVARVSIAAWSWYGGVITMCFIAGATIARARLIAASRLPADVAQAIASSPAEPDLWRDDERGEHTEREPVE